MRIDHSCIFFRSGTDKVRFIKEVAKAVEYCHFYGVPVEAELGCIGGKEDEDFNEADSKTDPSMVKDFVERTGCDLLAVAVGNVHGLEAIPNVDLPLLKELVELSDVPLVMHGGSGIDFWRSLRTKPQRNTGHYL